MEAFYTALFAAMAAVAAALEMTRSKDAASESGSREFVRFRNNYVLVYALMMGAPMWPAAVTSAARWSAVHTGCLCVCLQQAEGVPLTRDRSHQTRVATVPSGRSLSMLERSAQRATGCKARTCTRCTSTTALTAGTLAACSSLGLARP